MYIVILNSIDNIHKLRPLLDIKENVVTKMYTNICI